MIKLTLTILLVLHLTMIMSSNANAAIPATVKYPPFKPKLISAEVQFPQNANDADISINGIGVSRLSQAELSASPSGPLIMQLPPKIRLFLKPGENHFVIRLKLKPDSAKQMSARSDLLVNLLAFEQDNSPTANGWHLLTHRQTFKSIAKQPTSKTDLEFVIDETKIPTAVFWKQPPIDSVDARTRTEIVSALNSFFDALNKGDASQLRSLLTYQVSALISDPAAAKKSADFLVSVLSENFRKENEKVRKFSEKDFDFKVINQAIIIPTSIGESYTLKTKSASGAADQGQEITVAFVKNAGRWEILDF